MNFKKIALVVAMASSFAAHADVSLTNVAPLTASNSVAAAEALILPDLAALTSDGNAAYVIQEGDGVTEPTANIAYVSQTGTVNYSAVLQDGVGALAYVYQDGTGGNGNTAVLVSKDSTNTAAREDGLNAVTDDAAFLTAAEDEILAATLTLALGNVQIVYQVDGGGKNTALLYSAGTANFAGVYQSSVDGSNTAIITQQGDGNRAFIKQTQ